MKIFFYIHHLGNGGAERVTSVLANELCRRGNDVRIALFGHHQNSYQIDGSIKLIYLPSNVSRLRRYKNLRKAVKEYEPDVNIAVMPYNFVTMLIATIGLKIPLIVSDHTNFQWNAKPILKLIRYYLYRLADVVTVLSINDKEYMRNRLHNTRVMYNPLSFPRLNTPSIRKKNILCVGRLSVWEVKGFDLIIKIWGMIAKRHPGWVLEIAGYGSEDDNDYLLSLAKKEKVTDSIHFLGFCNNIKAIMASSSIFALPSRIEGFPCSLLEAMSQGCAPIAFEIHGIINEIITHGKDGFVIKDGDLKSFANQLEELIDNDEQRNILSKSAITSMERFEVERIGEEWMELLNNLKK